jgi:hypothetical protein
VQLIALPGAKKELVQERLAACYRGGETAFNGQLPGRELGTAAERQRQSRRTPRRSLTGEQLFSSAIPEQTPQ